MIKRSHGADYWPVVLGVMLTIAISAFGMQLSEFKWSNRVLLLFAPDDHDPDLLQIQRDLQLRGCDLIDRDMIVGIFMEKGHNRLNGKEISALKASKLRQHFGVRHGRFSVLLIGKDGGEKLRSNQSVDLDTVFSLIDGMPMRRSEISANPTSC